LTKEDLIDGIIKTEFSEWNDFFLYIVNILKDNHKEFKYTAAKIQHHIRHIEHFVQSYPDLKDKIKQIKTIPAVWTESILVIDDAPSNTDLLEAILRKDGHVDKAQNGEEAYQKISENYYRVIVSDVDMPVMNGLDFYKKAVETYPKIGERFIFFTGDLSPERVGYFMENHLKYLAKPSPVNEIKRMVLETMHQFKEIDHY